MNIFNEEWKKIMETMNRPFPWYEIHFLNVGDADCIAIKYQKNDSSEAFVALIDAGNVTDTGLVKDFLKQKFDTNCIDLAVCTHPDSDHMGGFFGLLEDKEITIREFWCKAPECYISDETFLRMRKSENKQKACRRVYNHPSDSSKNLLDMALKKINPDGTECYCKNVQCGENHDKIPLQVIGPEEDYYHEAAIGIVSDFAELIEEPDTEAYDENDEVPEEKARSVIDDVNVKENSPTNMGSLILFFQPTSDFRLLLTGDASSASLRASLDANTKMLQNAILKVPHHGSKHNLNSELIDRLNPIVSIISAAGTKKHPNVAIVRYLSKYGNVYSTHKSGNLSYNAWRHAGTAVPLRKKQE